MAKIVEEVWSDEEEQFFIKNEQHQTFLSKCLLERYQELEELTAIKRIVDLVSLGLEMTGTFVIRPSLVVEELMKRRLETEKKNKTLYASYMADFSQAQYEQSINPTLRESYDSEEERVISYLEKKLALTDLPSH